MIRGWLGALRPNPMAPWTWEAQYRDGRRLAMYDWQGFHRVEEIERGALREMVIHGHPGSPVRWGFDPTRCGPLEAVRLTVERALVLDGGRSRNVLLRAILSYHFPAGTGALILPVHESPRAEWVTPEGRHLHLPLFG